MVSSGTVVFKYTPKDEELNRLVRSYRQGDERAGAELLSRFTPLLTKYRAVLWYGKAPERDSDMGRFLTFFNKDKQTAAELLSISIRRWEIEDLDQVLAYSLLKTAKRYDIVSAGFKFVLKEEIAHLTRDALAHRTTKTWDGSAKNSPLTAPKADLEQDMISFLLEGSTLPGFEDLSLLERNIAKMAYIDEFTNEQVAESVGLTVRQVRRYRQKIREKLRDLLPVNSRRPQDDQQKF